MHKRESNNCTTFSNNVANKLLKRFYNVVKMEKLIGFSLEKYVCLKLPIKFVLLRMMHFRLYNHSIILFYN